MKSADPNAVAFLHSLRSNYELGKPPRKGSVEERRTIIHTGISMFKTREVAADMARRWPKLGDYVARVELDTKNGFNYVDDDGPNGHMTIWGRPPQLALVIADIYLV
jgi:hypothetical protein